LTLYTNIYKHNHQMAIPAVGLAVKLKLFWLLWPWTLTFWPLNGVMGFLPANFQLPKPFHSRLAVRHGRDRRRDINA